METKGGGGGGCKSKNIIQRQSMNKLGPEHENCLLYKKGKLKIYLSSSNN